MLGKAHVEGALLEISSARERLAAVETRSRAPGRRPTFTRGLDQRQLLFALRRFSRSCSTCAFPSTGRGSPARSPTPSTTSSNEPADEPRARATSPVVGKEGTHRRARFARRRARGLARRRSIPSTRSSPTSCIPRAKRRASSAPWRRATSRRRWRSRSTGGRCRASSSGRRRPSTRWSTSSARSRRK